MSSLLSLSDRDKSLVSNYLLGGAATGGGLALATALINYLKHLNKDDADADDETIRIYKAPQQEKVAMSLGGPLAITGGVLGAAGTYALVSKLYEMLRKKQAQEELDEAQNIFLESQGYKKAPEEAEKNASFLKGDSAGKGMSLSETAISLPLALPLLMALGSGVVAHKMLDKSFPIKKKKVQAPKRIEIVDAPEEAAEEEMDKAAGITEEDGVEMLLHTIALQKKASSDLRNLIATAARGCIGGFKKTASTIGYDNALDTIKGAASGFKATPFEEQVAISYLAKSASIGAQTKLLAAGEFAEIFPSFYKIAASMSDEKKHALFKIACILGHAIRSEISEEAGVKPGKLTKRAFASDAMLEALLEDTPESESDSNKSTDTASEEADDKKKNKRKFVYNSKRGLTLAKKLEDDDVIDKIMNPSDK